MRLFRSLRQHRCLKNKDLVSTSTSTATMIFFPLLHHSEKTAHILDSNRENSMEAAMTSGVRIKVGHRGDH